MYYSEIRNPFPDNVSDDGVSYAPQSWSERQAEIREMQDDQRTSKVANMLKSLFF